jgi:hypothetical protein
MAGTFLDDRQVVNRSPLSALGNTANLTLDVIMGDINTFFANATFLPTASVLMTRDANANTQANNFISNLASTVTAAGTTTLTVSSAYFQVFTGTSNQTVVLPSATTLFIGQSFCMSNESTGIVTVNANGGGLIQTMAPGTHAIVVAKTIATSAGTWDINYTSSSSLTNPMTSAGQAIYGGVSGTPMAYGPGVAGQVPVVQTGGTSVAYQTLTSPTKQLFTSTPGTITGYLFQVTATSGGGANPGDTYTNNGNSFVVVNLFNGLLLTTHSGSATFSGTTLTDGAKTLTFVDTTTQTQFAPQPIGTYTTPTGATWLKITIVGAGGGGGGCLSATGQNSASGGGGGGGTVIQWISAPAASYYYSLGSGGGGGAAGNNPGSVGAPATFGSSSTFLIAVGGTGGGGGAPSATTQISSVPVAGGQALGGAISIQGGPGGYGFTFGTTGSASGAGGNSSLGGGGPSIIGTSGGVAGGGYGAGGSGCGQVNGGGSQIGGNGTIGLVLIEEFYQ